jgi:hypothetical protein
MPNELSGPCPCCDAPVISSTGFCGYEICCNHCGYEYSFEWLTSPESFLEYLNQGKNVFHIFDQYEEDQKKEFDALMQKTNDWIRESREKYYIKMLVDAIKKHEVK